MGWCNKIKEEMVVIRGIVPKPDKILWFEVHVRFWYNASISQKGLKGVVYGSRTVTLEVIISKMTRFSVSVKIVKCSVPL